MTLPAELEKQQHKPLLKYLRSMSKAHENDSSQSHQQTHSPMFIERSPDFIVHLQIRN